MIVRIFLDHTRAWLSGDQLDQGICKLNKKARRYWHRAGCPWLVWRETSIDGNPVGVLIV
jgi:hypothetical protein